MTSKSRPSFQGSALPRALLSLFVLLVILSGLFLAYALSVYEEPPVEPGLGVARERSLFPPVPSRCVSAAPRPCCSAMARHSG